MEPLVKRRFVGFVIGSLIAWAFVLQAGRMTADVKVEVEVPEINPFYQTPVKTPVTDEQYLNEMAEWVKYIVPQVKGLVDIATTLDEDIHVLKQADFLASLSEQLEELQSQLSAFPVYTTQELSVTCQASYQAFMNAQWAYQKALISLQTTVDYSLLHLETATLKKTLSVSTDQLAEVLDSLEVGISTLSF